MFSLRKNKLTQRNLYTRTAHKSFTDRLFCTQKLCPEQFLHSGFFILHRNLYAKKKICIAFFTDRRFLHTENFLHGSRFTHRRFYTQHFLNTDAFTHRCLCTGTNCTQKLVHIARVYTQPTFTQRGFVSPSCSPTFRVPPQVYFLIPHSYAH